MSRWIRRPSVHLLLLVALPLILCLINDNWIFNPVSQGNDADPWLYNGLFRRYSDLAPLRSQQGTFYFIERVAWNGLGYSVYHLLPPVAANYALHLGIYYLAIFSLYGILSTHTSSESAFLSTILVGAYPWFLTAVGYDYTDGFNIAIFLLLLFLITLAFSHRRAIWLVAAGALYAVNLNMNTSLAGFLPLIIIYTTWLVRRYGKPFRTLFGDAVRFTIGMGLSFLVLAFIYYLLTGSVNYWALTLQYSRQLSTLYRSPGFREQFYASVYGAMSPNWHLLPGVLALAAIFYLARSRKLTGQQREFLILTTVLFLASYIYWTVLHFLLAPYLMMYLYASYVMPGTFLLLGCLVSIALKPHHLTTSLLLLVLPLALVTLLPQLRGFEQQPVLIAICGALALGALLMGSRRVFVGAFAVLGFLGSFSNPVYVERGTGRSHFVNVQGLMDVIDKWLPDDHELLTTWLWNGDHSEVLESLSLGYGFFWGRTLTNPIFPLGDGTDIVIALTDNDNIRNVEQRLAPMGVSLEVIDEDASLPDYIVYKTRAHYRIGGNFGQAYDAISAANTYYPESTLDQDLFVWTGPENETVLPLAIPSVDSDVIVEMCLIDIHTPNFPNDVHLYFAAHPIPYDVEHTNECHLLIRGKIDREWLQEPQDQRLRIDAEPTLVGTEAYSRRIGIAITWIRFERD